jgi:hypothetical protein
LNPMPRSVDSPPVFALRPDPPKIPM